MTSDYTLKVTTITFSGPSTRQLELNLLDYQVKPSSTTDPRTNGSHLLQ